MPGSLYAGTIILVALSALFFSIAWWQRAERKKLSQETERQYQKHGKPRNSNDINEAEVYLAYGRKSEAIRVLEEALKTSPTHTDLSDFLNEVRSGRAQSPLDPLKGKRMHAIGWMLIGLAAVAIVAEIALAKLLTPAEDSLVQFKGTLATPISFHRPPKGSLRAQFHLSVGQETALFNVAHVNLMPSHVASELTALPQGAETTVWVSHRSCIDEDGLDVWALSTRRTFVFSFPERAAAQKVEAKKLHILAVAFFGVGLLFFALHHGHTLLKSSHRTGRS